MIEVLYGESNGVGLDRKLHLHLDPLLGKLN